MDNNNTSWLNVNVNLNLSVDQGLLRAVGCNLESLSSIAASLKSLARDARLAREKYHPVSADVADITVSQEKEVNPMARKTWKVLQKAGMATPRAATKAAGPRASGLFAIIDGKQGVFQVTGLDSETPPVPVDISALASLTVTSDDPNVTVALIAGMTATLAAAAGGASGTANCVFTATANDGSFTDSQPATVTYSGGAITGIQVTQVS